VQNKLVRRIFVIAAPMAAVCGVLALLAPAAPQSTSQSTPFHSGPQKSPPPPRCSLKTIAGDYGYTIEGTLLSIPNAPPDLTLPIRGVSLAHYDGKGNKSQLDHVVVNGQEPGDEWTALFGSYTVNDDCTGWQEVFIPGGPSIRSHFIITKGGREIREVIDGNAVIAIGVRVE
jgi:hypothetical protein